MPNHILNGFSVESWAYEKITSSHRNLASAVADRMQRRYARLTGRGTTALFIALRAIALCKSTGEIILPDMICSTVLDAVLLAGFTPRFADIVPNRFTLDPASVQDNITDQTRGILFAHLFGYGAEYSHPDILTIEDAVQGLGGTVGHQAVGTSGDIAFISFHETKMIGGRGGADLTDDPALWDAIGAVDLAIPKVDFSGRYGHYWHQLQAAAGMLLRPFDSSPANIEQIEAGWSSLGDNVRSRNEKAHYLRAGLAGLPLSLPEIREGDAIWRYTFAAPHRMAASWILRHLQLAGLSGSSLYPSLSDLFAPEPTLYSASLAHRMINLWVDANTTQTTLDRTLAIIRSAPL